MAGSVQWNVPSMSTLPLEPPDSHHLNSATGWLELGLPAEALHDLDRISSGNRLLPDVLDLRWQVYARMENWELALKSAQELLRVAPERPSGYVHRSYALRRCTEGGLDAAWSALHPAHKMFPKEPIIPYNLACYAAQMGRLDESWDWLHKAMESAGDVNFVKTLAMKDPDLIALKDRIATL